MSTKHAAYDVAVIGGGPGGSTAAGLLARAGRRVVLFERERFPRHRIGESLLPATTLGIMKKLGAAELIENHGFTRKYGGTFLWGAEPAPWTFNFYKTSDSDRAAVPDREFLHSFQVERSVFDKLLLDHARSLGVEVREQTGVVGFDDLDSDAKVVRTKRGDESEEHSVTARFIVDAGGRRSPMSSRFGERHYDPFFKNVAIYAYWEGGKRLDGDRWGNILCVAFKDGWFWYIPLSRELTSVGLVVARDRYTEMKELGHRAIYLEMIEAAPMIREYLSSAVPCEREPYDKTRVDVDYSYIHSVFSDRGSFLVGDAACFIDPVFSSGVHLATYSAFLAATAIDRVLSGTQSYDDAAEEFERLYRREYMVFHRFLSSFYHLHVDHESYFWQARKVLDEQHATGIDAFISIVAGQSTDGARIYDSTDGFVAGIQQGRAALETLVKNVSGGDAKPTSNEVDSAREFMKPLSESRHRLLETDDPVRRALRATDLSDPDNYANGVPHDVFRYLREHEPISWRAEPNGRGYWAVTRYRDVLTVLRNPTVYSSWRGGVLIADPPPEFLARLREGMLNRDPPDHTIMRRLVNKAFSPKRVAQLESRIAEYAQVLVERAAERGSCDFATDIAGEMPLFVICEILGVPLDDRRALFALTERMLGTAIADRSAALKDNISAAEQMRAYGAELAVRKRNKPADDLVSDLLLADLDGRRLTDGEFQAFFLLLFNAGSDTTRSLLSLGLNLLLDRPDALARLRADRSLLPSAIEEMLRYESPVMQFRRTATRDVELGGTRIGEGDKLVVFFSSANRDETVFEEPDEFDITRSPNDHLAFGHGTHFCLGAPLARIECKHVFDQVLTRLDGLERRAPLVASRTNFIRGVKHLEIGFKPTSRTIGRSEGRGADAGE